MSFLAETEDAALRSSPGAVETPFDILASLLDAMTEAATQQRFTPLGDV